MHEEGGDDNGNGPEQVDENMQVGAANVHIFVGMPVEHDGAENIGDEADHADYKHDGNVDGFAVAEAFDGFEHDPNGDNGHAHGVEEGGHHFESFIAVGGGFRCGAAGQEDSDGSHNEPGGVGQHVHGVGDKREGAGVPAAEEFGEENNRGEE